MIPLFKVFMAPNIQQDLKKVLYSGYIGEGPAVLKFESSIAEAIGNDRVVSTNSGTAALTIALQIAGVTKNSYVISTPMTCLATNMPILSLGADILWADIDPKTGNIDPCSVLNLLTNYDNVAAIMCVHWAGYPCEMDTLRKLADNYGIPIIEDAAHAFLSEYKYKPIGQEGDFVCFSFQAIKHLTCGDGGALLTNNYDYYKRAQKIRWFDLDRSKGASMRCYQDVDEVGHKFHMNDISATIGLANYPYIQGVVDASRSNAERYRAAFKNCTNVQLLDYKEWNLSSYWLFSMLVDDPDDFKDYMARNDIATSRVHLPNNDKTLFKKFERPLPGVEEFASKQICIPCGWWVQEKELNHIINTVRSY